MQYIKGMQFYQNDKKTAITLGKFDGLHRGHETLIERVIAHQKNDVVRTKNAQDAFWAG